MNTNSNVQSKRFFPFSLVTAMHQTAPTNLHCPPRNLSLVVNNTQTQVPIDQQLANSFNANNAVMAYVQGIENAVLPAIDNPPAWFLSFQTAFTNVLIHADGWFPIAASLVSIPTSISGYGLAFSANVILINSYVSVLNTNPTDQAAITGLQTTLQTMIAAINGYSQIAVANQTTITNFITTLQTDATTMATAVTNALATIDVDDAAVAQFQTDINNLNAQIATWHKVLTAAEIAAGVSTFRRSQR